MANEESVSMINPIARLTASPQLPERYHMDWPQLFYDEMPPLFEGMTILDIGSGRKPAISPDQRPKNCRYIGLDPSVSELHLAGLDAYTDLVVEPIETFVPKLEGTIDLAISWQVFEHVGSLATALENIHRYLVPGGTLVAMLSGRNASFAVINRMIPERIGVFAMEHLLKRPPDTVFRAKYDDCTYDALQKHLRSWSIAKIRPQFCAAGYFSFSGVAQRIYLNYENRIKAHHMNNLASHYIVHAVRK